MDIEKLDRYMARTKIRKSPQEAPQRPITAGRVTIADTSLLRLTWLFLGEQWQTVSFSPT